MAQKKSFNRYDKNWFGGLLNATYSPYNALEQAIRGNISWNDYWDTALNPYADESSYSDDELYNYIGSNLSGEARNFWDSLSDTERRALIHTNDNYVDSIEGSRNLFGLGGDIESIATDRLLADLNAINSYDQMPAVPVYDDAVNAVLNGEDAQTNAYLASLEEDRARQTALMEQQLAENQASFDDYRSQLLSNQHQQNVQLMGAYKSEMSKARRSALEAGASAGLRMAENINTTLSLQNKQAQTSLETSNQLAQQLLNQRQAAAGIRSDYNTMLSNNASERRNYQESAINRVDSTNWRDYENERDAWEMSIGDTAVGDSYKKYAAGKQQSQFK